MTFQVRWLSRARRDLKRLDPPVRRRLVDAFELYSQTGHGDIERLSGANPPEYRFRVGDWRIRFVTDPEDRVLTVLRVLPREKAYRWALEAQLGDLDKGCPRREPVAPERRTGRRFRRTSPPDG